MFTGIIETTGVIETIDKDGTNLVFDVKSDISKDLKIDQSVSHDGICLTVVEKNHLSHKVVAIDETLKKTNLNQWKKKSIINLERCVKVNDRLDGHIVQGHIDQTAICKTIQQNNGSWIFELEFDGKANITVEKGSICVNGISLTVVNSSVNSFSVAIIPYTYQHTNLRLLKEGETVNLEFDIVGKYISKLLQNRM